MKLLRDDRGSTLTLIIMVTFVLSIMGLAILGSSAMAHRYNIVEKGRQFTLYSAESGLDEAYAQILMIVRESSVTATEKANEQLDVKMLAEAGIYKAYDSDRKNFFKVNTKPAGVMLTDLEWYAHGFPFSGIFFDIEGKLLRDVVNEWVSAEYVKQYKQIFNDKISENIIAADDAVGKDEYVFKLSSEMALRNDGNASVILDESEGVQLFDASTDDEQSAVLPIKSVYTSGVYRERVLTAKIEVSIPSYGLVLGIEDDVVNRKPSVLWTKALTAGKNIIVNSGDVIVNGNVYAGGNDEGVNVTALSGGSSPEDGLSGVAVGWKSTGKFEIVGAEHQLVSGGDVYPLRDGSQISVGGNVYCDNLIVDSSSENVSITIGKDLYTKDDLELNGEKSSINIIGSYVGFSDTAEADTATVEDKKEADEHRGSSGISISSPDINELGGSRLMIGGKVAIAGTGYLSLIETTDEDELKPYGYKTAESITVRGNYLAYAIPLDDAIDALKPENIIFKFFDPLYIAVGRNDTGLFTRQEQAAYFVAAARQDRGSAESVLNFGIGNDTDNSISIAELVYSLGATIYNGDVSAPYGAFDAWSETQAAIQADYLTEIKRLGNLSNNNIDPMGIEDEFVFDTGINYFSHGNGDSTAPIDIANKALVIVDCRTGSVAKDIVIMGDDASVSGITLPANRLTYESEDGVVNGVIVTTHDVYLLGNIAFKGAIITTGNIIFSGEGTTKTMINDINYIAETVHRNEALWHGFSESVAYGDISGYGVSVKNMYVPEKFNFSIGISAGFNTDKQKYNSPKRYVKVTSWSIN